MRPWSSQEPKPFLIVSQTVRGRPSFLLVSGLAPSWTSSNLIFGLDYENDLSLTIKITNLFDEDTHTYLNTTIRGYAEEFPGQTRDLTNRNEGRPRTVWLTMRKGFGS